MSAYRETRLVCNGPGCTRTYLKRGVAHEVRERAAKNKWVSTPGRDYCPDHRHLVSTKEGATT